MNASKFLFAAVLCAAGALLSGCDKSPSAPPTPKVDTITPTQPADLSKPSLPEAKGPPDGK